MSSSKAKQLPKNWPKDGSLEYLVKLKISKGTHSALLAKLSTTFTAAQDTALVVAEPSAPNALVRITQITLPAHPACGQFGLFAMRKLPPDSLIILYLGLVHTSAETDPASNYDLSMDRELGIGIDASRCGNEARFTNDYRGVAKRPNAEFRDCWVRVGAIIERRIGIFVKKECKNGLGKGQEILVSYGKGFWQERRNVE